MNDSNPNENNTPTNDVAAELHELGKNLREALRTAWESEERKKLQQEIETGLSELATSLSQATKDFSSSSTGQTLKADVQDLHERIRAGEVESKVRTEILEALRTVNTELQKAIKKNPPPPPSQPSA
jgi:signal recognition particle GTPase